MLNDQTEEESTKLKGMQGVVGDGWWSLIVQLVEELDNINTNYRITQIKEKFGELRFYISFDEEVDSQERTRMWDEIDRVTRMSQSICEVCGCVGTLRTKPEGSWIRTLCDECNKERVKRYNG